ncbi:MAG: HAD family hydrolase [Saprospirales bacterium]|nr:HAD family hydrolase [Saprospirales bacterium]
MGNRYRSGLEEVVQGPENQVIAYSSFRAITTGSACIWNRYSEQKGPAFQQSPGEKLQFVKKLQADGKKVCMIGDGLNDAGALRQSDTGIVLTGKHQQLYPCQRCHPPRRTVSAVAPAPGFCRKNINLGAAAYGFAW